MEEQSGLTRSIDDACWTCSDVIIRTEGKELCSDRQNPIGQSPRGSQGLIHYNRQSASLSLSRECSNCHNSRERCPGRGSLKSERLLYAVCAPVYELNEIYHAAEPSSEKKSAAEDKLKRAARLVEHVWRVWGKRRKRQNDAEVAARMQAQEDKENGVRREKEPAWYYKDGVKMHGEGSDDHGGLVGDEKGVECPAASAANAARAGRYTSVPVGSV